MSNQLILGIAAAVSATASCDGASCAGWEELWEELLEAAALGTGIALGALAAAADGGLVPLALGRGML